MGCTKKQMAKARGKLYSRHDTIKECSRAKQDDHKTKKGDVIPRYAVEQDSIVELDVSNFDLVQKDWYPQHCLAHSHTPCSVDAIHLGNDGNIYAIEFKCGHVEKANLIRKIHETVMGCIENLGKVNRVFSRYDFYRNNMVYVVVASILDEPEDKTMGRARSYLPTPWEDDSFPVRWDLKHLEGVLFKKAYTLSPNMFAEFAMANKWV